MRNMVETQPFGQHATPLTYLLGPWRDCLADIIGDPKPFRPGLKMEDGKGTYEDTQLLPPL